MKFRKITNYILVIVTAFMLFESNVFASSYEISTTSNSVTVGNSTTLKITGNDVAGKFLISSSNTSIASLSASSVWVENNTMSVTISTKNTGTATITVTPVDVASFNTGSSVELLPKVVTITVKAKPVVVNPAPKSSNSYLSSLSVDGAKLKEKFSKETLEYTVDIPAETTKIKINAQLADSSARVTGIGEVAVSDGLNTFSIIVTAENGSKRTYVLKATVLELSPIKITIDGSEYSIVRKRKNLTKPSEYYLEKDITIDNNKIEGYYNEKLDYTLVGLKNSDGIVNLYIYDNGKYSLYKEYTFNGIVLQILDKGINNYKKTDFIYEKDKITSYQEVKLDILKNTYVLDDNNIEGNQFYLFYAINLETGEENLYQYDAIEKTVQRYNLQILNMYKDRSDKYYLYLLGSILIIGIIIITFSTIIICMKKKKK